MADARLFLAGVTGLILLCGLATETAAQFDERLESGVAPKHGALLGEAESLLARNEAAAAYAMLAPRESELAGNPYYDYLLGVAALDTDRSSEAIFSLQRALAVEPRYSGAKMELARAYFEIGDTGQARPLFAELLDEQPPPAVRDVLARYIDAIDGRPARRSLRFGPWIELTAGLDTNANGSPPDAMFLGFTLSPENVETDSAFAELATGFNLTAARSQAASWYAGARLSHRANPDASFVDASLVSVLGGFALRRGAFHGRIGVDGYLAYRDGSLNQDYVGLDGRIGRRVADNVELELGLRAGTLRYDESLEVLDVDRLLYSLGAAYRLSPLASLRLEVLGGSDNERRDGSPYGNSKLGGRLTFDMRDDDRAYRASLGHLTSDFDGLYFGSSREDAQLSLILEIEFADVFTEGLSLSPRIRYTDNDSDIDIYAYDRTEIGLTFRWMPQ